MHQRGKITVFLPYPYLLLDLTPLLKSSFQYQDRSPVHNIAKQQQQQPGEEAAAAAEGE